MKTQELVTHLGSLQIQNSNGEHYSDFSFDAPSDILEAIHKAQARGQCCGVVYGRGLRWEWHERLAEMTTIEITSREQVVLAIEIPTSGWLAFKVCASRAGYDAPQYLAIVVAAAMIDSDMSLEQTIAWLFPHGKTSPEIQRFETAQRNFNAEGAGYAN